MKLTSHLLKACAVAPLLFSQAWAATINVPPGLDTLRTAVSQAVAGDVLVLEDGSYSLNYRNLEINKSLTIRAINAVANPIVYFNSGGNVGNYTIEVSGSDTDFVLQGIDFREVVNIVNQPRLDVVGDVNSVALLENNFAGVDVSVPLTYDQDSHLQMVNTLIVVGNRFYNLSSSTGSLYNLGAEQLFLFGANTVSSQSFYLANYPGDYHVIGNSFWGNGSLLHSGSTENYSHILGNLFTQVLSTRSGQSVANASYVYPVYLTGHGEYKNNIMRQGLNPYNATGTPDSFASLLIAGNGKWEVANNVFDQEASALYDDSPVYESSFSFSNEVIFTNNIIRGYLQPLLASYTTAEAEQQFVATNNLCFEVDAGCFSGDTNITANPLFKDDGSYELAVGSPAIDAGVNDNAMRDIDGTVADMGAYGGAYPYSQFAEQLKAGEVAPFFFPLFEANSSLSNTGELKIKAAAIARLR